MDTLNRRDFLAASAASVPWLATMSSSAPPPAARRPMIISSGNGRPAVERTMALLLASDLRLQRLGVVSTMGAIVERYGSVLLPGADPEGAYVVRIKGMPSER